MFRDYNKYEIYPDGRIWSYARNKWLKPQLNQDGYLRVSLSDNNGNRKHFFHHRVVYEACNQAPIPEGLQVNHIDENKLNNHISNLNLMTPKENTNWGTAIERTRKGNTNHPSLSKPVEQYDKDGNLINIWPSSKEIERELGYAKQNISSCCHGRYKQAYGFIWRYVT